MTDVFFPLGFIRSLPETTIAESDASWTIPRQKEMMSFQSELRKLVYIYIWILWTGWTQLLITYMARVGRYTAGWHSRWGKYRGDCLINHCLIHQGSGLKHHLYFQSEIQNTWIELRSDYFFKKSYPPQLKTRLFPLRHLENYHCNRKDL